jgi:hypothetical protein
MPTTSAKLCLTKRTYSTREIADEYCADILSRVEGHLKPYKCNHCQLWHLTSYKRRRNRVKRRERRAAQRLALADTDRKGE